MNMGSSSSKVVCISAAGAGAPQLGTGIPLDFKRVVVGGARYYVNFQTGHAYHCNPDYSQGSWAGLFHRYGNPQTGAAWIDQTVPEPQTA